VAGSIAITIASSAGASLELPQRVAMTLCSIPQGERELEHSESAEEDCPTRQRNDARERRCGIPSTSKTAPEEHQRETADQGELIGVTLHGLILTEVSLLVKGAMTRSC
jgi:hypothetical protein